MLRQTKIIATLGPAVDSQGVIDGLVETGVDIVRFNFSHSNPEEHKQRADAVRLAAEKMGRHVALLGDLQGPKIRITEFKDGPVSLSVDNKFILDSEYDKYAGTEEIVGTTYPELAIDVSAGDVLMLDDGRIVLQVNSIEGSQIITTILTGGVLGNSKGLNRKGGGLSAPALTDKDKIDMKTAAEIGMDYIAVSFPRNAEDIRNARKLYEEAGGTGHLIAKIERAEAIGALAEIMEASDAVMIARGDLGVEIGYAALPGMQKKIIRLARKLDCVVITATQMMESMVSEPIPTRAEVLDVANAVFDGTDAVMLSAETAVGVSPVGVVKAMDEVCRGAEKQYSGKVLKKPRHKSKTKEEAISRAAMFTAVDVSASAVMAFTSTGTTARWMSRTRTTMPIYALTKSDGTARRVALYRGVHPVVGSWSFEKGIELVARDEMKNLHLEKGDHVVMTRADRPGITGRTDTMRILRVGDE